MSGGPPGSERPDAAPRRWWEDRRWLAAAVAALTALAYVNAAPAALVFDDSTVVEDNPHLAGVAHVPRLFAETAREGVGGQRRLYRPVAMSTLALDHTLYGGRARGYHLTSIGLHVATTVLLFVLLGALGAGAPGAALAAAVFGVHPIHTEAVDVAFNRSEILACLGVVSALLWTWRWRPRDPRIAWAGAGAIFLLALLSRESAVSLPVIVVLALWLLRPEPRMDGRGWALALAAFAVSFAVYLAMRQAAVGEPAGGILRSIGSEGMGGAEAPLHRLTLVAATVRDYWRMVVWPWPLRASYEDYALRGAASALALHAALLAVAAAARRRAPAVTLGIAFFYVAILPSTRLLADPALLAERFAYLPSAGLAIPLAFGLTALARRVGTGAVAGGTAVLVITLGAVTLHRNAEWRSREALWEAEYRRGPDDWRVLLNLSQVRLAQQRFAEAVALCDRGIALGRAESAFHANRGLALAALGQEEEAVRSLRAAASAGDAAAYANLGRLYASTGRLPLAEEAFGAAIARETDAAARHVLEGERFFYCRGDAARAWEAFQAALALSPDLASARHGLQMLQARAAAR
jgi:tetratricopeptide (TPR) repeat protein